MHGTDLTKPFSPPRMCCEARGGLFKFQSRSRKQFSPLSWHCEDGASLFMCGKYLTKPFSPPMLCCEARGGPFKWQRRSNKQFSPLSRPV